MDVINWRRVVVYLFSYWFVAIQLVFFSFVVAVPETRDIYHDYWWLVLAIVFIDLLYIALKMFAYGAREF